MRVFVGIDLPEDIRSKLSKVQRELRPITTAARWVPMESAHLTLKFLGEISEQRLEEVHQAMTGLTWKPFIVNVRGIGFFPGARSPRVFWSGIHAPTLEALSGRIDSRMDQFGFEKEKRKYRAHVTLARSNRRTLETALVNAARPYEERDFGSFNVDRCYLYQSELTPQGPVYTKLREYLLS
jgi:2'-5' RNA ligase